MRTAYAHRAGVSSPIEKLLARLEKVRRTGPAAWTACCPAHADVTPSLAVKETPDGTALVHCFGGCSAVEVVGAAGLELTDLFPHRTGLPGSGSSPTRRPWTASELLDLAAREANVAIVIVFDWLAGRDHDVDRLIVALQRLVDFREAARAYR